MQKTMIALATATFMGLASVAAAANIVETARQAGTFNTLIAAAQAAGLADALTADGPLTVFAPLTKRLPRCLKARSSIF